MKQPVFSLPDESFKSLDYTYSFSKYSCVAWVYPLHIGFAYLVVLIGILAMLSRVVDKLRPYHATFGRWYLIFMFWCMACSLLIYTNGLPFFVIISFLYLMVSITIGWNAIKRHTDQLRKQVGKRINLRIKNLIRNNKDQIDIDVQQLENEEKGEIISSKSLKERLFSYKMLHGLFMSFSWYQLAGRLMVTNPFHFDGCWTYPAYKSEDYAKVFAVDSVSTPEFPMKQGVFLAMITVPTIIIILVVAYCTTNYYYRQDLKKGKVKSSSQSTITQRILTN